MFKQNGFEVDLVSETGTYQADWLSQQPDWLKDEDKKTWEDSKSDFRQKLDAGLKPRDLNPDDVGIPSNEKSFIDHLAVRYLLRFGGTRVAD